jgi:hypothetical protein
MSSRRGNQRSQIACLVLFAAVGAGVALGQGSNKKPKPATPAQLKSLDAEADKLQQSFLAGLGDLAQSYEDAGQVEKSKAMLQEILKIDPENATAQQKLKAFDEAVFSANEIDIEVDSARGWTATNLAVTKDKPVRFVAEGTYKFIVNETVGPDGFSTQDVARDMADAPLGALVGVVMPPRRPGDRQDERQRPPGRTFYIGSESEHTPLEDGIVFLKLNVPPASKCVGKVRVVVSGNIKRAN